MSLPPFEEELSLFDFRDDSNDLPPGSKPELILPASFQDSEVRELNAKSHRSVAEFLLVELDVSKLNHIHKHLWLAGLERFPRALQHQKLIGREVVCTEETNLHLLWTGPRLFVKPCPDFLLSHNIWASYLCTDNTLYKNAFGLLLTYVWLVRRQSDLAIAKSHNLLPDSLTWPHWTRLSASILAHAQLVDGKVTQRINPRYHYGELRLDRLNWIYPLCSRTRGGANLMRGYFNAYHDYQSFFARHITWISATTVYVALVLTAMQVGLATPQLQGNGAFQNASYAFTVFAILGPLGAIVVLVVVVMGSMFVGNLQHTLRLRRQGQDFGQKQWEDDAVRDFKH